MSSSIVLPNSDSCLFVTGGTGFIGSHFLRAALDAGYQIIALRRPGSEPRIDIFSSEEERRREQKLRLKWVEGDLSTGDLSAVKAELKNRQAVLVHLAAHGLDVSQATWRECFRCNVEGAVRLLLESYDLGIRRFIVCGSCFEYGRSGERFDFIPADAPLEPTGPYHASKAAASLAAFAFGIEKKVEVCVLRPFHVFGEGEAGYKFWPSLRKSALAGEDFPMTEGRQVRDFIPVAEVATAFLKACNRTDLRPGGPTVENVGTGCPQTLREFAEHWWTEWAAEGRLLVGAVPYRADEVMRYVPALPSTQSNG